MSESLRGRLLIATPTLNDPNFRRSVVLICAHGDDGALGLVLNRPSPLEVVDAVPELEPALADGARLWLGGPVQPEDIVLLADFTNPGESLMVSGDIGLVTDGSPLESLPDRTRRVRAFLGHSGWGPGQLDSELEREDWIIAPLDAGDPFDDGAEDLWRTALEELGGQYALVARMPDDPSLN
jgi:putative transcriptional regulator